MRVEVLGSNPATSRQPSLCALGYTDRVYTRQQIGDMPRLLNAYREKFNNSDAYSHVHLPDCEKSQDRAC